MFLFRTPWSGTSTSVALRHSQTVQKKTIEPQKLPELPNVDDITAPLPMI